MNKEEIREKISEKRKQLSKQDVIDLGEKVKEKLFSLEEYKNAKTVMFFMSFGKEIHTHKIVEEALKNKTVVVPKIVDNEIVPCVINDFTELQEGRYRILEPVEIKKANPDEIDIVLVPGIAFDKGGYRIGYGKGYYDHFLKDLNVLKIGLCMDFQVIEKIPNEELDVKINRIITEKSVIIADKS